MEGHRHVSAAGNEAVSFSSANLGDPPRCVARVGIVVDLQAVEAAVPLGLDPQKWSEQADVVSWWRHDSPQAVVGVRISLCQDTGVRNNVSVVLSTQQTATEVRSKHPSGDRQATGRNQETEKDAHDE